MKSVAYVKIFLKTKLINNASILYTKFQFYTMSQH